MDLKEGLLYYNVLYHVGTLSNAYILYFKDLQATPGIVKMFRRNPQEGQLCRCVDTIKENDIHIKAKSYKFEILEELVV